MFKKTMKFDDLDGNEVTQTFYFNYNKKEVAELIEFGHLLDYPLPEGQTRLPLEQQLTLLQTPIEESGLTQQENSQQAYSIFQDLILDAYGEKGPDNVTFVKNKQLRDYFKSHVAYVEIIFEFLEKPSLAAQFIENCLPAKFVEQAKKELESKKEESDSLEKELDESLVEDSNDSESSIVTDGLTDEEILAKKPSELSKPQLLRAMEIRNK